MNLGVMEVQAYKSEKITKKQYKVTKMIEGKCIHAGDRNSQGLLWCNKKNRYVSGDDAEKDHCEDYEE